MHWKQTVNLLHRLRSRKGRCEQSAFSVEGYRLIERALESHAPLQRVLCSQSLHEAPNSRSQALLEKLKVANCPIEIAPDCELQNFVEGRTFGSLLGIVSTLPSFPLEEHLLNQTKPLKLLVLVEVMDPGNLGALARTAMASGVDALIVVGGTDLFHPKAVRTSMGSLFTLPTLQLSAEGPWLEKFKRGNIQTIGAVVRNGIAPHTNENISHRHALFMGSEAHGLSQSLEQQLDLKWTIPMPAIIDSFSVNAATAVLLYELNRQSWKPSRSN